MLSENVISELEAEETEILEKLENGKLIAVVSNTAFSTLASSHCVEHFVFCHLVPGLDEFFKQCEPAFASGKNTYLHLIYNREQDVEGLNQWLTQKYPDEEALGELYRELRRFAETDDGFITKIFTTKISITNWVWQSWELKPDLLFLRNCNFLSEMK